MTQEQSIKYKELLENEKIELERQLKGTPLVEDMGSDVEGNEDMSEETDEAEAMANNAAIRAVLETKLDAINSALNKIENDSRLG